MKVLRRRLLGLAFFVVVALFLTVTIMFYNKSFTTFTSVKLTTDSAGNSLPANADVKVRGVVVGQVREVEAHESGGNVTVTLGLDPDKAKQLPQNVTARILPKTLFGERYVALQTSDEQSSPRLRNGDTIDTDRSGNAMEVQQLFDKLLPVLQAIPPQDLNVTLSSIAKALSGNGARLGTTIDQLGTIFARFNQNMPDLSGTIRGLATVSQTYSEALPDVIDALDNFRTTSRTVVEKQNSLKTLFAKVTQVAKDGTKFFADNRQELVTLTVESEPALSALAKQSPALACTFKNFASVMPNAAKAVGEGTENPGSKVTIQFVNPRGRYLPNQDEPRIFDDRGPICYQQTDGVRPFPQYPGGPVNDGSYHPPSRNPGQQNIPYLNSQYSIVPTGPFATPRYSDRFNQAQLRVAYGAMNGVNADQVPGWVTLIGAPALVGTQVTIK